MIPEVIGRIHLPYIQHIFQIPILYPGASSTVSFFYDFMHILFLSLAHIIYSFRRYHHSAVDIYREKPWAYQSTDLRASCT